ncbi:MAG: hypothetical protein AAGJ97_04110 [Planctomycetota bacterium]
MSSGRSKRAAATRPRSLSARPRGRSSIRFSGVEEVQEEAVEEIGALNFDENDDAQEAARKTKAAAYAEQLAADLARREETRLRLASEEAARDRAEEAKLERERAEIEEAFKRNEHPKVSLDLPAVARRDEEARRKKREEEDELRRLREAEDDARVEREQRELAARFQAEEHALPKQHIFGQPLHLDDVSEAAVSRSLSAASMSPPRPPSTREQTPARPPSTRAHTPALSTPPHEPSTPAPEAATPPKTAAQEDTPVPSVLHISSPPLEQQQRTPAFRRQRDTRPRHDRRPHVSPPLSTFLSDDTAGWIVPPTRDNVYSYKGEQFMDLLPQAAAKLEAALDSARGAGKRGPPSEKTSPLARAATMALAWESRPGTAVSEQQQQQQHALDADSLLIFPDGTTVETTDHGVCERLHDETRDELNLNKVLDRNAARLKQIAALESAADLAIAAADDKSATDDALAKLVTAAARPLTSSVGTAPRVVNEDSLPNAVRWAYRASTSNGDLVKLVKL